MAEEKKGCASASTCSKESCAGCASANKKNPFEVETNPNAHIKHVIGIVSGKGGVGKSFVTSSVASMMAKAGYKVGILDADITGPSIPKMFGVHGPAVGDDNGTFPIEAAMMAADMAPGMNRHFLAENWEHLIPKECWEDAREEAGDRVNLDIETDIQGFDIDAAAIKAARANAKMAGVDRLIHFQQRAVKDLSHPKPYGFIITNPPYGERLEEKEALPQLYREIGESYNRLDKWSMYLITSYDRAENDIGRKADKNRKIYNGMLKTYYYQFLGPKPPRRKKD